MQPGERPDSPSRSFRAHRTHPALPGMTSPTTPVTPRLQARTGQLPPPRSLTPSPDARRRLSPARRAAWKLLALGLFLAFVYLALYPLFAGATTGHDAAKAAWLGFFPWLTRLFWTAWTPVTQAIGHVAIFKLEQPSGFANLLATGFVLAFVALVFAARVARNVAHGRLLGHDVRLLFWIIFAFTALFGLLFLFAPAILTQDAWLYGLYGRIVTLNHSNPYTVAIAVAPGDILHGVLLGSIAHPTFGPVWMDAALTVALFAHSAASILFDFRLVGLVVHLVNTVLIWQLLARTKPEARFAGTLLYAWNPAPLLLGIAEMHLEIVVILFVLLAALFYQRRMLLLSWVCLLLSAMIDPFSLLFFPLFLSLLWKAARSLPAGRRAMWWLALVGISAFMIVLAYLPYWSDWSMAGIGAQIGHAFIPGTANQSLASAIQHLPVGTSHALGWLATPPFWSALTLVLAACLLMLGLWLAEKLELVLLFASWLTLAFLVLSPFYQPWFALLPLSLAIASASSRTTLLAMLLAAGALLAYIFSLSTPSWAGQGLVTVGLPVLIWGWSLFFATTWHMTRARDADSGQVQAVKQPARGPRFSRPSWPVRSK